MAENYEEDDTPERATVAFGKAFKSAHGNDIGRLAEHVMKPLEIVDKGMESLKSLKLAPGPRKLANTVGRNVRLFSKAVQPVFGRTVDVIGKAENVKDLYEGAREKNYKKAGLAAAELAASGIRKAYTFIPEMALADWKYTWSGKKPANNDHGIAVDDIDGDNELGMDPEELKQIRRNGAIKSAPEPVRAIRDAALFNPVEYQVANPQRLE